MKMLPKLCEIQPGNGAASCNNAIFVPRKTFLPALTAVLAVLAKTATIKQLDGFSCFISAFYRVVTTVLGQCQTRNKVEQLSRSTLLRNKVERESCSTLLCV